MTCTYMSFSTVFQSHQDDGRVIMKDCVQWNHTVIKKIFDSGGSRNGDC